MTPSPDHDAVAADVPAERERGSRAALSGIVFAALFVVGWLLLRRSPSTTSTNDELVAYYATPGDRRGSLVAGLYVVPFASIAFIWFMAALRDRYVRAGGRENVLLSTVHLLSGTLFVAGLFLTGAVELALVWMAEATEAGGLNIDAARGMIALGESMAQIVAVRAAAVFIAISTTRARRIGLFPRWFTLVSFGFTVALLVVFSAYRAVALAMPAWVLATSLIVLTSRSHRAPDTGA